MARKFFEIPLSLALALLAAAGGTALAQPPAGFTGQTITCDEMRKHPAEVFTRNVYLRTGTFAPIWLESCPESLENLPFLRRLLDLTATIHGPIRQGNAYDLSIDYAFNLAKAGFAPRLFLQQAEADPGAESRYARQLEYFSAWSRKSSHNHRLRRAFLAESEKALPRLAEHYRRRFHHLSEAESKDAAQYALRIFADRAFGAFPSGR